MLWPDLSISQPPLCPTFGAKKDCRGFSPAGNKGPRGRSLTPPAPLRWDGGEDGGEKKNKPGTSRVEIKAVYWNNTKKLQQQQRY